jgi:hypothetical protein
MFIQAKLVPKSYKPLRLEQGMFFVTIKNDAIHLHTLNFIPRDVETYSQLNGWPVELYIVFEGNPNLKEFEILATPEQIGWFDDGEYSDEISDITIRQINKIFSDHQGYLAVEFDHITNQPTLYDNKVTIRYVDESEDEDDWEEFDEDEQDNNNDDFEDRLIHD